MEIEHPDFGRYTTTGMPLKFESHPTPDVGRSPKLGEHTAEVLAEIGFDADTVARMMGW
ncbi:MAG: formyl-CoA transferase, partial [Candidatus Poriferisodalaceae bacterium]